MIPQILLALLWVANLMVVSYKHGKPKEGKENVWNSVIALGIVITILYFGGWFKPLFN